MFKRRRPRPCPSISANAPRHRSKAQCEALEPRVLLAADPMTFSNVGIGGGSYIIGAEVHPLDSNLLYASTDIGGLYRKDGNNDLKPLLDWVPYEKQSLYGVSGFDVKPNDTNVIVATLGKYDEAWNPGHADQGVYVSFDKGENWAKSGPTLHQDANNQVGGRGGAMGSRIAFDPSNPRYMIAGSSGHGTYVVDTFNNYNAADDSYTYISSLAEGTRTQAIDFDPSNANNIYIAIRDVGIYRTSGGVFGSFSLIPGSPTDVNDMEVNGDGTKLLVATDSAVRRLDNPTFNNSFTTINLPDFNNDGNNAALTINRDPNATDRFYTARPQTGGIYTIARTEDAGTNWNYLQLPSAPSEPYDQQYDWHLGFWPGSVIADIEVDPNDSNRVIFTDWFSMWETTSVFAPQVTFSNEIAANHEEVVGLNLAPAFAGNADNIRLFSGLTDVGTVRHADLNVPVQTTSLATGLPEINDTTGVVTTAADPNRVYVAGIDKQTNSTATVGVSFDAGETYTDYNSYDGANWGWARIAVSNGDANRIVAVTRFGGVRWSNNSGQTWNAASGLPNDSNELGFGNNVDIYSYRDMIAADGGNNNTFYLYRNTNGGQIYRSTDGGATWNVISSNVPATNAVNYDLRGVPGQAGHLWLAIKGQALRYSTDGGFNWNVASEIQDAFLVASGKEKPGFNDKTIYTFGRKAADDGYYLYGSTDVGASWQRVNDDRNRVGNETISMAADQQVYGVVYVGTNGRGVYKGEVNGSTPPPPPPPTGGSNQLTNDGFESGLNGWSNWGNTVSTSGGVSGNAARTGTGAGGLGQHVAYTSGTVDWSIQARATGGATATVGVQFIDDSNGWTVLSESTQTVSGSSYQTYSQTGVVAPTGTTRVQLFLWKNAGGETFLDNTSLAFGNGGSNNTNLVANGSFDSNLNNWNAWTAGGASATLGIDNGNPLGSGSAFNANIANGGSAAWNVSLEQSNIALTVGTTYTLTFKARASSTANINVFLENNDGGNWTAFDNQLWGQSISTSTQTYSLTFTATRTTATLKMQLGGNTGNLWIDDVDLVAI